MVKYGFMLEGPEGYLGRYASWSMNGLAWVYLV